MTDLNYTNAAIAAGFTADNDIDGKLKFRRDCKHIYFRDANWFCYNTVTHKTSKYSSLREAIEVEK